MGDAGCLCVSVLACHIFNYEISLHLGCGDIEVLPISAGAFSFSSFVPRVFNIKGARSFLVSFVVSEWCMVQPLCALLVTIGNIYKKG